MDELDVFVYVQILLHRILKLEFRALVPVPPGSPFYGASWLQTSSGNFRDDRFDLIVRQTAWSDDFRSDDPRPGKDTKPKCDHLLHSTPLHIKNVRENTFT